MLVSPDPATKAMTPADHLRRIRMYLVLFIVGLALSGITAFPLVGETAMLLRIANAVAPHSAMQAWVARVHAVLVNTGRD